MLKHSLAPALEVKEIGNKIAVFDKERKMSFGLIHCDPTVSNPKQILNIPYKCTVPSFEVPCIRQQI